MTARERRLDNIRATADKLLGVARKYDELRWKAEQDGSDAFLALAEQAGKMTEASLDQLATLLELMWQVKDKGDKP